MKKRVLNAALAALLALSLGACGGSAKQETKAGGEKQETKAASEKGESAESKAEDASSQGAESASSTDYQVNEKAAADPKVKLVMAEVNPLDTIVGKTDLKFKEAVESISGGSISIDLQASGVLGSENDVLDSVLAGGDSIDISRISAFALTSYGGEKSKLLSVPFTFESREHFWKFAQSDLAKEFLEEPKEKGLPIRGLFYGEEGFRHFFTKEPAVEVKDLKGRKLRVSNDPIMTGMVQGFGANPTVVPFNELYSALQTGVVDGAEQPMANYLSNAFPEVAPNLVLDGHTLGVIEIVISDKGWAKLTENQQKVLEEAGRIAGDYDREIAEQAEKEVLTKIKSSGVNVVEVTDKAPWKDACKKIIEDSTKSQAELYQKILDYAS